MFETLFLVLARAVGRLIRSSTKFDYGPVLRLPVLGRPRDAHSTLPLTMRIRGPDQDGDDTCLEGWLDSLLEHFGCKPHRVPVRARYQTAFDDSTPRRTDHVH